MDALIERLDGHSVKLSDFKVMTTVFEETAAKVARNSTQLDGRNGSIDFGGWHSTKSIQIEGWMRTDNEDDEIRWREQLFAWLTDPRGYYVTRLITEDFGRYEMPGESSGGVFDNLQHHSDHKRFYVYCDEPTLEFQGTIDGHLLYKLAATMTTLNLPYGETKPQDLAVTNGVVPYFGTVSCSQIEQGFNIEFTATAAGDGVSIKINDDLFTYKGAVAIGDVLVLSGYKYTKNGDNVTKDTNKTYFTLEPFQQNKITVNLAGTVRILHQQDLFV